MLDYLNWYLVELERNLRGRHRAQSNAEFLLESRSHLEERVDELVKVGVDRSTASKTAILDFGDPKSVAQAYCGLRPLTPLVYRVGVTLTAILGVCVSVALALAMIDAPNIHATGWVSGLTYASMLSFPVIAWLAWRTRKWVAVPICGLALGFALLASVLFTVNTGLTTLRGNTVHVFMPQRQSLIDARVDWLRRYDGDFAKLNAWRASSRTGPDAVALLQQLAGPQWEAPVQADWLGRFARVLPSDTYGPTPWVFREYGVKFHLQSFHQAKGAAEQWRNVGDDYAAFLKKQHSLVEEELLAFTHLQPSSFAERWMRHGWQLFGIVAVGSLFAFLMNGVLLIWAEILGYARRRRWRRQVS